MTNAISGSTNTSNQNTTQLFADAIMVSLQSNKKASVLTVKNYNTEANGQKAGINQAVADNYQSYNDDVQQYNKQHRHKILHAVFGAIFHIAQMVIRPVKAIRKDVRKVVTHSVEKGVGKEASGGLMSRMFNRAVEPMKKLSSKVGETFKPVKKAAVKLATTEKVSDHALKFVERAARAGEAGMHIDNGVFEAQSAKAQEAVELLELAKNVCESNYQMDENTKKQEMQHLSSYLSDRSETLKMVDQLINNKGSVQAQLASSI
jgi:hypothetical protein